MKKLIRKGVYETNSSSSHSISIASEDKQFVMDVIYPNQDGIVTLIGGEFGWDWFKHNDAETKANYAAQSFNNDDNSLELLKEVIMEQTGAENVIFQNLDNGYIDHDSYGIVPKTKDDLRNFIFNKNSWLFGGNDNESVAPDFYIVSEYRDGKMIKPKFKYSLCVDGLQQTIKFLEKPTDEKLRDAIDSLVSSYMVTEHGTFLTDTSVMWQIVRPRGVYFELSYRLHQDYSTGEILFMKENDYTYHDIEKRLENEGKLNNVDWDGRCKLITKELLKIPGLIVKVKFTIKEL